MTNFLPLKPVLFLLFCAVLLCSGCKKEDNTANESFDYSVENVTDIYYERSAYNKVVAYTINHLSGPQQKVQLSINGLPTGITIRIDPASGYAPYTAVVTFDRSYLAVPGDYPLQLTTSSAGLPDKVFTITLKVK